MKPHGERARQPLHPKLVFTTLALLLGILFTTSSAMATTLMLTPPGWGSRLELARMPVPLIQVAASIDAHNQLHFLYTKPSQTGASLVHARYDLDRQQIAGETILASVAGSTAALLTTDPLGNAHVVWLQDMSPAGGLLYAKINRDNQAGIAVEELQPSGKVGSPAIGVDSQGTVHVLWEYAAASEPPELYYARIHGTRREDRQLTPSDARYSAAPSLVIAPEDNIHILWFDERLTAYKPTHDIFHVKIGADGTLLVPAHNITAAARAAGRHAPAMAADAEGRVHLLFIDERPTPTLLVKTLGRDGTPLTPDTTLSRLSKGVRIPPSIAVDAQGTVHAIFVDIRENWGLRWLNNHTVFVTLNGVWNVAPFYTRPRAHPFSVTVSGELAQTAPEQWVDASPTLVTAVRALTDRHGGVYALWLTFDGQTYRLLLKQRVDGVVPSLPIWTVLEKVPLEWLLAIVLYPFFLPLAAAQLALSIGVALVYSTGLRWLGRISKGWSGPLPMMTLVLLLLASKWFLTNYVAIPQVSPRGLIQLGTGVAAGAFVFRTSYTRSQFSGLRTLMSRALVWILLDLYYTLAWVAPFTVEPVF